MATFAVPKQGPEAEDIRREPEERSVRGRSRLWNSKAVLRIVPLLLFLGFWEIGALSIGAINVAGAIDTAIALFDSIQSPIVWRALADSNIALFYGYAVAVAIGIPIALLMGRVRAIDALLQAYLSILLIAPMAMLVPLIIMAIGFGNAARSLIVCLFVIPMIVVNVRTGVRTLSPDLIEMAQTFGASEFQVLKKVVLPGVLPSVFTGLRIGIGRAVTGMVIAEWLLSAIGVGALLLEYRGRFLTDSLFALIILVLIESLVLVQLVRIVERRKVAWALND